ncbi:O-antigen ligase family protein [Roseateles sp.]|uniref:O-antigen ligase family protein n=1 Tax=Roseateles sp. TaxID=1971397 RepID=UPI0039EB1E11
MTATQLKQPVGDIQRWLACGLVIIMGVLPLWPAGHKSAHDFQRAAECLILLAASFSLWWKPTCLPEYRSRSALAAASLVLLILMSCWHSRYTAAALQEVALWLGLLGWAWVCRQRAVAGDESTLLRAMAAAMAAYAATVLLLYLTSLMSGQLLDARGFMIGFSNPRFLNHVQTVAVPLLWVVAASDADKRWRALASGAAMAQIALTVLTLARATFLAWLVALIVLTLSRECRISRQGWTCLVSGLLGALLLFLALPSALDLTWRPSFASPTGLSSAHSRDLLWTAALDQFLQSPWLGQGPMHFAAQINPTAAHPHNVYLQLAAELGLPASLLVMGLMLMPLAQGLRCLYRATPSRPLLAGALAATMAALVDGAFSGNFVMPLSQLWIATAWGLMAGAVARCEPAAVPLRERRSWSLKHWAASLLLATQFGLCVTTAMQAAREPPRIRADSPVPPPGETYRPRFWLDGWI